VPNSHVRSTPLSDLVRRVDHDLVMLEPDETLNRAAMFTADCRSGRTQVIGSTRSGSPLTMFSLGTGPVHVLVLGSPHPNEPVSAVTVPEFLRVVAAEMDNAGSRSGLARFTFDVVAVWDLDGARLSTGAYRPEPDLLEYHSAFYRPAPANQPEWTFPTTGRGPARLPETGAVMRVIDDIGPAAVVSLHNADIAAGAYFTTRRVPPTLAAGLSRLPARFGIPLERAPADACDWKELAPGVREMGHSPRPEASCSLDYAARTKGAFGLATEVPQWYVTAPDAPGTLTWRRSLQAMADQAQRAIEPMASTIVCLARQEPNCPVAAAALAFLTFTNAEIARCRNSGSPDDAGTRQARWAADWVTLLRLPLRLAGLVLTLARPHPCRHPLLEAVRRHAGTVLQTMIRALSVTTHPRPVPLSRAVKVQFAAILCAASAAAEEQVGDANPVARARPDRRRAASP